MSILEEVTRILTQVKWPIFHLALEIILMLHHGESWSRQTVRKYLHAFGLNDSLLNHPCIHETPQVLLRWPVKTGWQLITATTKSVVRWRPHWCAWQSGWIYRYLWIYINTIKNSVSQIRSEVFPFLIHSWFFLVSSWWIIMYYGHPWPWTMMDHQLQYSFLVGNGPGRPGAHWLCLSLSDMHLEQKFGGSFLCLEWDDKKKCLTFWMIEMVKEHLKTCHCFVMKRTPYNIRTQTLKRKSFPWAKPVTGFSHFCY